MQIKLIFDMKFCGKKEEIVNVPINITEREIKKLFPRYIGVEYNDACSYEIVGCNS